MQVANNDQEQRKIEQRRLGICLTLSYVGMGSRLNSLLTQQTSFYKEGSFAAGSHAAVS